MNITKNNSVSVGLIITNTKQILTSKSFYISILLIVVVMLFTLFTENIQSRMEFIDYNGVCYEVFLLFYFGILPKLVVLISTLPVVTSFCTDWNTQYIRLVASRTGVSKYARHKVYSCITGTFFTSFVALLIFTLILLTFMPITTESGTENVGRMYPFGGLVEQHPYLFQLIRIICFSSFCSVWGALGLALSAYIPNRYIVYASPFVIYYIIEQLINNKITSDIPTWLYIPYLGTISLTTPLFGNYIIDFLYINLLFIGLSLLIGEVFVHGAKRRMRNEIV